MKTIESVIVEVINGREYSAVRVITGTIKIRQYIVFRGHTEHDSRTYSKSEKAELLDLNASHLLWQLVVRGLPGQSPLEPLAPTAPDS